MNGEKQLKVYVVDDDPMFLEQLKDHLTANKGCQVNSFVSGEKMLAVLENDPDVIILDYHMDSVEPDNMDGLEMLKRLKVRNKDVVMVMLSSEESEHVLDCSTAFGSYHFIHKNEDAFIKLDEILKHVVHK